MRARLVRSLVVAGLLASTGVGVTSAGALTGATGAKAVVRQPLPTRYTTNLVVQPFAFHGTRPPSPAAATRLAQQFPMYPGKHIRLVSHVGGIAIAADMPLSASKLPSFTSRIMILRPAQPRLPIDVYRVKFVRITAHRWNYTVYDPAGAVVKSGRTQAPPYDALCNVVNTIQYPLTVVLCDDDPLTFIICNANPADPTSNGLNILCPTMLSQEVWPPNTVVTVSNFPNACSPALADNQAPAFCSSTVWVHMESNLTIRNQPGYMPIPGTSAWRYWQFAIPYNGNSTSSTQSVLTVTRDEKVGDEVYTTYVSLTKDSQPLKPYAKYIWATNTYCVHWTDGADGIPRVGCDTAGMAAPGYAVS